MNNETETLIPWPNWQNNPCSIWENITSVSATFKGIPIVLTPNYTRTALNEQSAIFFCCLIAYTTMLFFCLHSLLRFLVVVAVVVMQRQIYLGVCVFCVVSSLPAICLGLVVFSEITLFLFNFFLFSRPCLSAHWQNSIGVHKYPLISDVIYVKRQTRQPMLLSLLLQKI